MNLPPRRDPNTEPRMMAELQARVDECALALGDSAEKALLDPSPANKALATKWQNKLDDALRELESARDWWVRHNEAQRSTHHVGRY